MTLTNLSSLFWESGCRKLYAKVLAENDNSKNQVYFGPGFQALNLFPNDGISADSSPKNPIFKAKLRFAWLQSNGSVADVPAAQLILYPQYPEVRFSGFLRGCALAPSELMAGRHSGRILFLGVTEQERVIGFVVGADSPIAAEFHSQFAEPTSGVFHELKLPKLLDAEASRSTLLAELGRINRQGWIDSKQLAADGSIKACNASNCGGFTLEAELGIAKNSQAEPDFMGWEVKQHTVSSFDRVQSGVITLMTPEPNGGFYCEQGVEAFVRRFGYADQRGRTDRMNFGGIHKVNQRQSTTHLTMILLGYDLSAKQITDVNGCVGLVNDKGEVAASWAFTGLLKHWSKKHSKAVYVPSKCSKAPVRAYQYGDKVRLAQRTDSLRLLGALAGGSVYYDPGIKLENISGNPKSKRRSQFRVASKNIESLYEKVETVNV